MSQQKRWLLAISPFIVMGGLFAIAPWVTMRTFACDRREPPLGQCYVLQSALQIPVRKVPLNLIRAVDYQESRGGRVTTRRIIVRTEYDAIRFATIIPGGSEDFQRVGRQIKGFIQNPNQQTLRVTHDDRLPGFFWGSFFWAGGAIVLMLQSMVQD